MAFRGQRPKAGHLRLMEGNKGHRPIYHDPVPSIPAGFNNGLVPPKALKNREQQLWDEYIVAATWLTKFEAPLAFMWVSLTAEFEKNPAKATTSRIAQIRQVGSELGFDPSSRARRGIGDKEPPKADPGAKYFE
jgi:hypothetical protein